MILSAFLSAGLLKKKFCVMNLSKEQIIEQAVKIISYGMEFQRDMPDENPSYILGVIEATSFIASCYLVQELKLEDGIAGSDLVTALDLHKMPKAPIIRQKLNEFLNHG